MEDKMEENLQNSPNPESADATPESSPQLDVDAGDSLVEEVAPKKSNSVLIVATLAILVIVGGWFVYQSNLFNPPPFPSNTPSSTILAPSDQVTQTTISTYFSIGDIRVGIPEDWEISISQKTDSLLSARAYPPGADHTITFAEIQIGGNADIIENSLLTFSSTESVNGLMVREGQENLLNSQRAVIQVEQTINNTKAVITFFGSSSDIKTYHQSIVDMLTQPVQSNFDIFHFIKQVKAQDIATGSATENANIAGIPLAQAKSIEIMGGPYPERITNQDTPYKGGYAKLYKFDFIKGQRVEVLSEENREDLTSTGSFIESEFYYFDPSTNTPTKIMNAGTRISPQGQFDMETGTYYLLVNTYPNKVGRFLVKVFDLDQVQDLFYVKFADGSEHPLNTPPRKSSNQEAVILVRFTGPIEVIGKDQVRWFRKTDNACISSCLGGYAYGDITVPFSVQVNSQEVPIKITKLFMNQAIIQPADGGGFPVNSDINYSLDFGEDPNIPGSRSGFSGGFSTY
jgi:hypothetical protein